MMEVSEMRCKYKAPDLSADKQRIMDEQIERLNSLYFVKHEAEDKPVCFKLEPYHKESLQRLYAGCTRQIVIKGRQVYYTTFCAVLMFDFCIYRDRFSCVVHNMTQQDMQVTVRDKFHYIAENSPFVHSYVDLENGLQSERVVFKNGSEIRITRSGRSHTANFTLLTEAAYTADVDPTKYGEVYRGTTHGSQYYFTFLETSPYGSDNPFIDLSKRMLERDTREIIRPGVDFPVLFVPWWKKPANIMNDENIARTEITPKLNKYFDEVQRTQNIILTLAQKSWYVGKLEVESKGDMQKQREEHPSTIQEALTHNARVYIMRREMGEAERDGRLAELTHDRQKPALAFWDFGSSVSHTAFIIMQKDSHQEHYQIIESYQAQQENLAHFIAILRGMGYNIVHHFLPHDAGSRSRVAYKLNESSDITIEKGFRNAGIWNTSIYPRVLNKKSGFDLSQLFASKVKFDNVRAMDLIDALRGVKRLYDARKEVVFDVLCKPGSGYECNHLYDCFELAARAQANNQTDTYLSGQSLMDRPLEEMIPRKEQFDGVYL